MRYQTMCKVDTEIRNRIKQRGKIPFAEFMELALYWPKGGYYSSKNEPRSERDFYTAPAAHPLFGMLLAVQFVQMWETLGRPNPFWVIEIGAGPGHLCYDVMTCSAHLPGEFRSSFHYICLDLSNGAGIEGQLDGDLKHRVQRLVSDALPFQQFVGCIVSNELLDSFPVHKVTIQNGHLKEIYVALKQESLVEILGDPSTSDLDGWQKELPISLKEGLITEISLAQTRWISEVAACLKRGFVLTLDYGYSESNQYSSDRLRQTLTCYYRHVQVNNPFERIGLQDITAHVDFIALQNIGSRVGLQTLGVTTQRNFLRSLGADTIRLRLQTEPLTGIQLQANRMGMLDLIRPDGLGKFRVLVQGKGEGITCRELWGLGVAPSQETNALLSTLPLPLLTRNHIPLMLARYPHLDIEYDRLPLVEE